MKCYIVGFIMTAVLLSGAVHAQTTEKSQQSTPSEHWRHDKHGHHHGPFILWSPHHHGREEYRHATRGQQWTPDKKSENSTVK